MGIGKQLVYHNHHTGETDCTQTGFTIPTQMTDYMIEDRQHNLWVTQGENGIYRLSADNKSKHF